MVPPAFSVPPLPAGGVVFYSWGIIRSRIPGFSGPAFYFKTYLGQFIPKLVSGPPPILRVSLLEQIRPPEDASKLFFFFE